MTTTSTNDDSATLPSITIVGLGPGAPEQVTVEAWQTLLQAECVHLRTRVHPTVASLPPTLTVQSFDHLYESAASFDEIYGAIAAALTELALTGQPIVYAVPGHPLVGEESVRRLVASAREYGITVRIVAGLSFIEPVLTAVGADPLAAGLQIVDATAVIAACEGPDGAGREPFRGSHRVFDSARPALIAQVYSAAIASHLKLALLEDYPPDHQVWTVRGAGLRDGEAAAQIPLSELDRGVADHLTTVYVPALPPLADVRAFDTFRYIVARLRAPDGCPWDREQTHQSLRRFVIEEAYEVVDALDSGDTGKLAEELGDLLLQVALQAQIGVEHDEFALEDVFASISSKLIRRHPHVFGDWVVGGSDDVLRNWDQIKRSERASSGESTSLLASVPKALPALSRAHAVQRRAARAGFDWARADGAFAKVTEELDELRAAETEDRRAAELGDLLLAAVAVARRLDLDPEEALREATDRFVHRFDRLEGIVADRRLDLSALPEPDLLALWSEAKASAD
jgi:tetrapyrrole methylase family protein / MazG family protein